MPTDSAPEIPQPPEIAMSAGTDVQMLRFQMGALQAALESGKQAVEDFRKRAAEHLEASEQRYRELFDNVLSGVYRMAPDGRVLLANPALVRMLGFDNFGELAERKLRPPERLGGKPTVSHVIGLERSWRKKSGERLDVRESCRAVREGSKLLYYEGIVEDVTAQKRAALFEGACRQMLEMVARNEPLDHIIESLVQLLEKQLGDAFCCLNMVRNGRLYLPASPLVRGMLTQPPAGRPLRPEEPCGRAMLQRRTVVLDNQENGEAGSACSELAVQHGLEASCSVPILAGRGGVLGSITLYRKRPQPADEAEARMLETVARLAGLAIEHRQLYEDLERQATRDKLTGLPNRVVFEEHLARSLDSAAAVGRQVAVLWLDLDRFKEINDTLGHQVGDELIRLAARRLEPVVQPGSLLARTGGDEFALVSPHLRSRAEAEIQARRLIDTLRDPFQVNGFEVFVTASAGIAVFPDHGATAVELQQNADAAMYQVKSKGKNGYMFYEPALGENVRQRLELANSLRRSLERREFELHYQPQIDLAGNLRGLEALLRWKHPSRGLLAPGEFIPLAEETGLIVPIGAWVIEEACRQCALWNWRRDGAGLKVAVNVSAVQFYFSDLVYVVRSALTKNRLDPRCLELELTESVVMRDARQSAAELAKLRSIGVTIAIDDFGTGYSSLSYLQQLPVDVLKIDRCFLEDIHLRSASALVEAITALAHGLGLQVVAEGIEQVEQMRSVARLGVDLAQGFLIGRPQPASKVQTGACKISWNGNPPAPLPNPVAESV